MDDVRANIDRIDRAIVPLLLERLTYIKAAAGIKAERGMVRDEARVEDVVSKAKATASSQQGDTAYIEDIYRFLIEWSIAHETNEWDAKRR